MSYEPRQLQRNDHWQPGEVLPSRESLSSLSPQLTASNSFVSDSSLGDEDVQYGCQNYTEKQWEDVESLIRMNFANFEGIYISRHESEWKKS